MPIQPETSWPLAIDAQHPAPSTAQVLAAVQARLEGLLDGNPLSLSDWKSLPGDLKFHLGHVMDQTSACIALRQQVEHIEDALCPYPLVNNPVLQTAITFHSLFGLEKMPGGALLIEEYLNHRLGLARQQLKEREQWLVEAIDDLRMTVNAMQSPFHAARLAASAPADESLGAACDAAGLEEREPGASHDASAPAPADTGTEVALVGYMPPSA